MNTLILALGLIQEPVTAFVNVNVVPMDRERVLSGQTVVVRGGRIAEIGPSARVKAPSGATIVDGAGKYLIPGLAEMHAHIPPGPQVPDSVIERVLGLFVLKGVTTVRGMLGDPRHLPYRDRARRGEILSPLIYTSSPSLNGGSMPTGAKAVDSVVKYQQAGYDFMKVHPGIRRPVFDSIVATAQRVGIRFAGHVPLDVGIDRAIEAKFWSVDHLDGFMEGLDPASIGRRFSAEEAGFFGLGRVAHADESRIAPLAAKAKAAGVWMVPTETLMRHVIGDFDVETMRRWPEMAYWSKAGIDAWVQQTTGMRSGGASAQDRARYLDLRKKLIKGLHSAGVGFILGSDAPQVWNVPGFSVQRELAYLVDAGLTPYQALETGTRNVALYLGTLASTGTVSEGKRADLVLLDGNPLESVGNVGKQAGVMIGGRWLGKQEIDTRLAAFAAK